MYNKPLSCAYNNGFWSEWFELFRSARQGCCFSPSIFNLVVEVLRNAIRNNPNIHGLKIGREEVKAGQYADDLWTALVPNSRNVNCTLNEISNFGKFSGLKLNYKKTAILRLGPYKDSEAKFYTLKQLFWSPGYIKILGVWITPYESVSISKNFYEVLDEVKTRAESWKNRNLTVLGKVTVVNSLLQSLFLHKLMSLPTPPDLFFKMYEHIITEFIWEGRIPKIAYRKLIQDYNRLGLKLIDLKTKELSLKAAWPVKWADRDETKIKWIYQGLPIQDRRIWECNMSAKDTQPWVKNSPLSTMHSIWSAWNQLNSHLIVEELEDILDSNLWGNTNIRRENKPIFDRQLVSSNIDKIIQIYDMQNHKFYTQNEIIAQFGPVLEPLFYCALIAAIPKYWKVILHSTNLDQPLDRNTLVESWRQVKTPS